MARYQKKYIYGIINPKGSIYIGQTGNFASRMDKYRRKACIGQPFILHSLKKYGFDSHEIKKLHELPADVDPKIVNNYEQLYIQLYKDAGFVLMNLTDGGAALFEHTEETKRAIGLKNKGKPSKGKGQKRSEETCRRMSIGRTGKGLLSDERKKAFGEKMKLYANDPKRTEAISRNNKGRPNNNKGPVTDETKRKLSESLRKYHALKNAE